jgi:hypothetical protein
MSMRLQTAQIRSGRDLSQAARSARKQIQIIRRCLVHTVVNKALEYIDFRLRDRLRDFYLYKIRKFLVFVFFFKSLYFLNILH